MRLINVNAARSIWLFNLADLNPRGRALTLPLFSGLTKRYRFLNAPSKIEELDAQKGIIFDGGQFPVGADDPVAVRLAVYNDGLLADTRSSTTDSDRFLEDVLRWASDSLDLSPPDELTIKKVHASELYVQMENPFRELNEKLEEFSKKLTESVVGYGPVSFQTAGISFATDPSRIASISSFKLEKAEGTIASDNRFYSVAPLQTEIHLQLLEELEGILCP